MKGGPTKDGPAKDGPNKPAASGAPSVGSGASKSTTAQKPSAAPSGGGTPPKTPANRQQGSGGGFGKLAAAAMLGGVVGAGLLWLLTALAGEDDARTAELETLQARVASLETAEPIDIVDTDALEQRFATVEAQLSSLPAAVAPEDVSTLSEALAALEAELTAQADRLEALASSAPSDDVVAAIAQVQADLAATQQQVANLDVTTADATLTPDQVARLVARIEALEARPAGTAPVAAAQEDAGEVTALREDLAALRDQFAAIAIPDVSNVATTDDVESLRTRLGELAAAIEADRTEASGQGEALRGEIAQLSTRIEEAQTASSNEREALSAQVEELTGRLDTVDGQLAELGSTDEEIRASLAENDTLIRDVQQRLGEVGGTVDGIVAQLDQPGDRERAVAAVALAGLQGAVDRGEGYATYLATLSSAGVISEPDAQVLSKNAEGGVPTRAALISRWEILAPNARRAAVRSEATTGVASLLAGARSLVDVSPSDPTSGSGVPAQVARISSQLRGGSLLDALATWERLPEASRAATRAWANDARSRLSVEGALANASDAILSQFTASASDG